MGASKRVVEVQRTQLLYPATVITGKVKLEIKLSLCLTKHYDMKTLAVDV
jgi:hypothetical protein